MPIRPEFASQLAVSTLLSYDRAREYTKVAEQLVADGVSRKDAEAIIWWCVDHLMHPATVIPMLSNVASNLDDLLRRPARLRRMRTLYHRRRK